MRIHIPNAKSKQLMSIDEGEHFLMRGHDGLRHRAQIIQNEISEFQMTERKLSDHKRMRQNFSRIEQFHESRITPTQMIDPNRRVGQNHLGNARRRRGATNRD